MGMGHPGGMAPHKLKIPSALETSILFWPDVGDVELVGRLGLQRREFAIVPKQSLAAWTMAIMKYN